MMNGLGSPMPPQEPSQPMAKEAMPQDDVTMGTEPASPDEQAMYDKFVSMGLLALYDEKMMKRTVDHLTKQPDKAAAVGEVAAGIFQRVYASAKEGGANVPGDVLINAMTEIVEATVELSDKKAGTDMTDDEIESALYKAMDIVRKAMGQTGEYSDDMRGQDAAALQAMSQNGEIQALTGGSAPTEPTTPAPPSPGTMGV